MPTVSIPTTAPAAVDTVDELADVSGTAGEAMIVAGFAAVGDGGGGPWTWSGSSTATHDGYLVVRPSEIAAADAGRWLRNYTGPVDARWFGCLPGLGSLLPQNENLQLALDAVAAAGGGHVLIAAGVYDWANAVSIGSNTRVSGAGIGRTTIRGKAGAYTGVVVSSNTLLATLGAVGKNHVTIEHITVDHQTNSTDANGIALIPTGASFEGTVCTDCTVQHCEVLGYDTHEYLIWSMRGQRIQILNNRCDGYATSFGANTNQEGIEAFGGYDVLISGNSVRRVGNAGINCGSAEDTANCEVVGLRIVGNHIEDCRLGIALGTAYDVTYGAHNLADVVCVGNVIEDSYEVGVQLKKTSAGTSLTNILIADNAISAGPVAILLYGIDNEQTDYSVSVRGNAIDGATTTTQGAITALYMFHPRIDGNSINDSAGEAIRLTGCIGGAIVNNTVEDAQKQAVMMDDCNGTVVARNHFCDYGLGLATGGLLSTNSVLVVVRDNEWTQAGVGTDVIVSGTSGIVTGNIATATGAAIPFTNTCTAANFGVTAAMTVSATTIDVSNSQARSGSRFVVTQLAGTPLSFKVGYISGGFRITTATAAVGDETFRWEIL